MPFGAPTESGPFGSAIAHSRVVCGQAGPLPSPVHIVRVRPWRGAGSNPLPMWSGFWRFLSADVESGWSELESFRWHSKPSPRSLKEFHLLVDSVAQALR